MPIEFRQISSLQLETLPRERTVFFFPVAPLEDHGPHLPMGLDLEEANSLCYLTAKLLEETMPGWVGVLMPSAPLGVDSNTSKIAITVRSYVLRDWLVDACNSLTRVGFCQYVCFSGHLGPRQLTAIEEAGKIIRRSKFKLLFKNIFKGNSFSNISLVSASSSFVHFKEIIKSPFWPDPVEHGGKRDTSVALVILKDWMEVNYKEFPMQEKPTSFLHRAFLRMTGKLESYWGDPQNAQQELGEKEISSKIDVVFPKLRAVWSGTDPNQLFRSWYSILPPNKSFFKAWLMVLWIISLLIAWGFLYSGGLYYNI